jgi:hypothetical protein
VSPRAVVAILAGQVLFIALIGWSGAASGLYLHGCHCVVYGWAAAWRTGLIAVGFALAFWLISAVYDWVRAGDDR